MNKDQSDWFNYLSSDEYQPFKDNKFKKRFQVNKETPNKGTYSWRGNKIKLSCGCHWEWDSGCPLDIFEGECCEYHGKKQGWI